MGIYAVKATLTYRVEGNNNEQAIEKALDLLRNDLLNKSVSAGDFAIQAEVIPSAMLRAGL